MRVPGWHGALHDYVTASLQQPFVWGQRDCATFAFNALALVSGRDLMADARGYASARGAVRALRRLGLASPVDRLRPHFKPRAIAQACTGDIAVLPGAALHGGQSLGVVMGAQIFVMAQDGLQVLPLTAAHEIFEV